MTNKVNNNTVTIANKVYSSVLRKLLNNNYNKEPNKPQRAVKIYQVQHNIPSGRTKSNFQQLNRNGTSGVCFTKLDRLEVRLNIQADSEMSFSSDVFEVHETDPREQKTAKQLV